MKRGPIVLCCVAGWLIASAAHAEEPATAGADVPPPPPPALRLHSEFEDAARLRIDVEYPPAGAVIRDSACGVFVAGRAGVRGEGMADCRRSLAFLGAGKIVAKPMITHRFPLEDVNEALQTFIQRKGGALKVVVQPNG